MGPDGAFINNERLLDIMYIIGAVPMSGSIDDASLDWPLPRTS
jgi:hypothetical protein